MQQFTAEILKRAGSGHRRIHQTEGFYLQGVGEPQQDGQLVAGKTARQGKQHFSRLPQLAVNMAQLGKGQIGKVAGVGAADRQWRQIELVPELVEAALRVEPGLVKGAGAGGDAAFFQQGIAGAAQLLAIAGGGEYFAVHQFDYGGLAVLNAVHVCSWLAQGGFFVRSR